MENVNLLALSLQDMRVFVTIAEAQNVSEAARKLGISQPTASYALEKLRRGFRDPLLVRRGGKMQLTAIGNNFLQKAQPMLDSLSDIALHKGFDPATTQRVFHIMGFTSDLQGPYKNLIPLFRERAPNAGIIYHTHNWDSSSEQLHDDVDLYVGSSMPSEPSINTETLRSYPIVIYYDPNVRDAPADLDDFLASKFVQHNFGGKGRGVIDQYLIQNGYPPRKYHFLVNNFSCLANVAWGTDLLVTASTLMRDSNFSQFAVAPLPMDCPNITYEMRWSKRKENDPGLKWLIELFRECNDANPPSQPPKDVRKAP